MAGIYPSAMISSRNEHFFWWIFQPFFGYRAGYIQKRPGQIHKIQQLQDGIQLKRPGEFDRIR